MSTYYTKLPNLGGANAMNTIDHIVEVNSPLIRGNTLNESLEHSIDETRPLLGIDNIMTATTQLPIRIKASKIDHPQLDLSLDTPPQVEVNPSYHFCFQKGSNILRQPFIPSQRRRRRSLSDIMHLDEREISFSDDVGQAASETYRVTRLSFTLLRYLGFGYRWILRLSALGLYALFLMPGIVQAGCYYIFSKTIKHNIVYGEGPRNRLDLYIPKNLDNPKPVVAFVTGGAWIIGYKAWGVLLGQQLAERDVIVACIDYRNFPQGTISDMVKDASKGISFICNNIGEYGGDPNRIYLAGQSAGAHIAACVLVEQAKREMECDTELTWRLSHLKAYIAISGGYNLFKLVNHFHSRGLYRSIFVSVMEGEKSLVQFSPELVVQSPSFSYATSLLPPFYLFHGMEDYSIPCDASTSFAESLSSVGASVKLKLYPGKTHTDLFLQDPMRGGYDSLFSDILKIVHMGDPDAEARDAIASPRRRMVPEILLRLARMVSPF